MQNSIDNIIVTKLFDVMTIPISTGTYKPITKRYAYGLSFCATPGGKIIYEHNGKKFLSDCGHAIFLPMGQTYMLNGVSGGEFPLLNFYCDSSFSADEFMVFEISGLSYYLQTYERIKKLSIHNQPFYRANALSLLYEMLGRIMINSGAASSDILAPALSYIDRNYTSPELTVETAAAQAHISEGYFRRTFKAQYGVSPKKYILNSRIAAAKEMLLSRAFLSVTDVAERCGFTNVYHFDRTFREYVGCSPTEYIQLFGQKL